MGVWVPSPNLWFKIRPRGRLEKTRSGELSEDIPDNSSRRDICFKFIFVSFLMGIFYVCNSYYIAAKTSLFFQHFDEIMKRPWLLVILACEVAMLMSSLLGSVDQLLTPHFRARESLQGLSRLPTVDILLCCCNETLDIILDTVKSVLALDYPIDRYKLYVLDDGADDELQAICHALQADSGGRVTYIRRLKLPGVPHNYKAGNMNNALQYATGEYVVPVDADMLLHSSFLRRLLPYVVYGKDVAYVQVPQSFYNLPPGDPLGDGGFGWYEVLMPRRDRIGATPFIGTGAVFKRKCLDVVGGFQYQSATEDVMTSVALFSQGYKSAFVKENLQMGLAAWTFEGFLKQRERWGVGAIQIFFAAWRDLLGLRGRMPFLHRLIYIQHTFIYYMSVVNMILLITLLVVLALGLQLTVGTYEENVKLLAYLAVTIVTSRVGPWLALTHIKDGVLKKYRDDAHYWWIAPYYCVCVVLKTMLSLKYNNVPTGSLYNKASTNITTNHGGNAKRPSTPTPPGSVFSGKLRLVAFHIVFVIAALATIVYRIYCAFSQGFNDCHANMLTATLSVYLLLKVQYMSTPIWFVFSSANQRHPATARQSLLRFDANGTPVYNPSQCYVPKARLTWLLEILPFAFTLLWCVALVTAWHPQLSARVHEMCPDVQSVRQPSSTATPSYHELLDIIPPATKAHLFMDATSHT